MAFPIGVEEFNRHVKPGQKIGRMRHKAYFLTPTVARDEAGGESITWVSGSEFFCHVEWRLAWGADEEIADRYVNVGTAHLTCRYRTYSPKNKIMFQDMEWEIEKVEEGTHQRYLRFQIRQYKPE